MSRRKFDFQSEDKIQNLQQVQLKKTCESKCNWAVTAYRDWRNERLLTYNYDYSIYMSDIDNLANLKKAEFNHLLCRFVPEVTKSRGEGPFPGKTLYQMVVAIQKHLWVNHIFWQLIEGIEFVETKTVLNNVMMERTKMNIGVVPKQAEVITFEFEEKLWKLGVLGEDNPTKLRNTVLFLLGINCLLRAVEEHYCLRRDMPKECSQIAFKVNDFGEKCLVYTEDCVTKTHDGGLSDMRRDRKVVWVFPNKANMQRCPVRLVQKYISLCPKGYYKKSNFYLQSLQKLSPNQWYGERVVGQQTIGKVIKKLMEEADIQGYFTNHSARRTGGTRLFQAGIDRKLVKEATGHMSDAVDKYQVTSHAQRKVMSEILAGNQNIDKTSDITVDHVKVDQKDKEESIEKTEPIEQVHSTPDSVGQLVTKLIEKNTRKGKTVIKIEIEITNE